MWPPFRTRSVLSTALLAILFLLGGGNSRAQTLNDLWRGAILNCGAGQPCVNITNVATAVPFTTPQTLNDLLKGAFQLCGGIPCLTVTGAGGGGGSGTVNAGTIHQLAFYAATGTAVSGEAAAGAAGTFLKSNGTDWIVSTGSAAGTGSCTNQVVTAANADAVPTCSNVSNAMLTNSSITLNAGTNVGLTTPGAVALGGTGVIGNTSDKVQLGSLGLGVAAPTVVGQAALTEAASTGTVAPQLTLTGGAHTALTASTERFDVSLPAVTHQWATGALALQERVRLVGETLQAVGASTFTNAATLSVTGPIQSTNVTLTNAHALYVPTWAASTASLASALTTNAPSGATTNLAAALVGNVSLGVLSPGVANRNVYISSGSGSVTLALDPVSAAGAGGAIQLYKSGTFTGGIYHESAYTGAGTSSDTSIIQGQGGGKIKLFPNGDTTPTLTVATSLLIAGRGDASGTPTSATVRGPNADGSTSNVTGSGMTVQPGLNSGTAVPASINIQGGALGTASGATLHTAVSRHTVNTTKILTNSSAIAIVNATVASNTVAMQTFSYGIEVFNGTDLQLEAGFVTCVVINKGGVFSANTCTKSGTSPASATTGTLTVTFAISAANPAVISVNASSSLTPNAGYPRIVYEVANSSQNDIAIQ